MKKKIRKLYKALNRFYGGESRNPFTLRENHIEYFDGVGFVIATYQNGFYHYYSSSDRHEETSIPDAESMHLLWKDVRLDNQVWDLFDQFNKCMGKKGIGLDHISDVTGISSIDIEAIMSAQTKTTAVDLHEIAWALGMKLVLVDAT